MGCAGFAAFSAAIDAYMVSQMEVGEGRLRRVSWEWEGREVGMEDLWPCESVKMGLTLDRECRRMNGVDRLRRGG